MSIRITRIAALALSLALVTAAGQPALAADGSQQAQNVQKAQNSQQSQQSAPTPDFSEQKLNAFADAAVKVSEVRRAWAPKIRKAQQGGDKQKAQQLARQATGEMRTTIQDTDNISVKEYRQIAKAAQQDKQLAQKLSSKVKEKMNNQGQGSSQQGGNS